MILKLLVLFDLTREWRYLQEMVAIIPEYERHVMRLSLEKENRVKPAKYKQRKR